MDLFTTGVYLTGFALGLILSRAGSYCGAAHQVRQVGSESSVGRSSRNSVAVDAGCVLEELSPRRSGRVLNCGLLLTANPSREVLRTIDRDSQKHLRVLGSAILCALAKKNSGALRVHPHPVRMIRDKVCLARKLRNIAR
jgi:hypothetical protein